MKKILITGAGSFIGQSFERSLQRFGDDYRVHTVDMTGNWQAADFSGYDSVFHVAGIAHADIGKVTPAQQQAYYAVNRDLTAAAAAKAKAAGVPQFVFMSSIIIYGKQREITADTVPAPANFYGDSKLQAEQALQALTEPGFSVAILRPPMIYGRGCKGNYPTLAKLAQKFPIFPDYNNRRSMLHIDNLCEFLRLVIENGDSGIFFPQNAEYVKTAELVRLIAECHGKKIRLTRAFNPLVSLAMHCSGLAQKAFGSMTYDLQMSAYPQNYRIRSLEESVRLTEENV